MRPVTKEQCGEEITDLRNIKDLALQKKSIVWKVNEFQYYRLPAAFVQNWSLWQIMRYKFFKPAEIHKPLSPEEIQDLKKKFNSFSAAQNQFGKRLREVFKDLLKRLKPIGA